MKFYVDYDRMNVYTEQKFAEKEKEFLEKKLDEYRIEQEVYEQISDDFCFQEIFEMDEEEKERIYNEYFTEIKEKCIEEFLDTFRKNFKVIEIITPCPNISIKVYDLT